MSKKLYILFFVVFLDLLGFGIIIPILPLFIQKHGGNPFLVGALIATFSFFQFLFSPIFGRLSDKYGRKKILIFTSFLNALSYFFLFFTNNIWLIFLSRIIGGIGSSNVSVIQAYLADVSKSHERTKLMAIYGSFFSLGFIIGPFIGGFLSSKISFQAPFLVLFF